MEKSDKGSTMIQMGVSGWMFLLVPAYPGCPGLKAVKRSLLLSYPLNPRTGERVAGKYFTNSWGYGAILISRAWISHPIPYFRGEKEIAPNFVQKCDGALIRRRGIA